MSAARLKIAVVMGSKSDWETMRHAVEQLRFFGVEVHSQVVSAHRTPDLLAEFAKTAIENGFAAIIAGAGGAAHLPGMLAAHTTVPVLGVPVESAVLRGVDSLLSIVQMPAGIPVATFAIGKAGATNAALFAVALLANTDPALAAKLEEFRRNQTDTVLAQELPVL
ncbi:MAG TPA: 5-(carboxyamino)imidazole ribonucleotide mutase [Chthoniobacterales bacterium]